MVAVSWIALMLPRMVVTALLPTIELTYNIRHAQAGLLMTSYFYAYTLPQIPAGVLADRFSRKKLMIIALVGSSLGALILPWTQDFTQMVIFRAVSGLSAALWYAPSISLLTDSVPDRDRGKAMGVAYFGSSACDAIIYLTVGILGVKEFSWKNYFIIFSIPGFLCALIILLFVKERKRRDGSIKRSDKRGNIRSFLSNKNILSVMAFNFVVSLVMFGLLTFLPTYFVQVRGLRSSEASFLMMAYATPVMFAGMVGGFLVDHFGYIIPCAAALATLCLVTSIMPVAPFGTTIILLIVLGLIGGKPFVGPNVLLTRIVPSHTRGTALGIQNSFMFFAAATGPLITGYVADLWGFDAFFAIIFCLCILAAVTTLPIVKTYWKTRGPPR